MADLWPAAVRALGPSAAERAAGSAALRRRQRFGRLLSGVLGQVRIDGLEWVPVTGPVVLAVNHSSLMDGVLLFGRLPRVVSFLVKAEAFSPLGGRLGRVLVRAGQLPVRRGGLDPLPVRSALELLSAGAVLGIFPEGTRGDGRVEQARPGVGYFAMKTGARVVPVAIHGSYRMTRRRGPRRPPVLITVGEPLVFERAGGPLNRRRWLAATELIRAELAELVRRTDPMPGNLPASAQPRTDQTKVTP